MQSDEIARLQRLWRLHGNTHDAGAERDALPGEDMPPRLDLFDATQLRTVITVCRTSRSLSDAGRTLYAVSRAAKAKPNDADRLKKYLARVDLDGEQVSAQAAAQS